MPRAVVCLMFVVCVMSPSGCDKGAGEVPEDLDATVAPQDHDGASDAPRDVSPPDTGDDTTARDTIASDTAETCIPPCGLDPGLVFAAGGWSTCVRRVDATIRCWGDNSVGQGRAPEQAGFVSVAAGVEHACGIQSDGAIVCWGLAFGDTPHVFPDANAVQLAIETQRVGSGMLNICWVDRNAQARCWLNAETELFQFPGDNWVQVDVGPAQACATRRDGEILCHAIASGAFEAATGGPFANVSVGGAPLGGQVCAVGRVDGALRCWGDAASTPPAGAFRRVSLGQAHGCALRDDGEVVCWGDDTQGRLAAPTGPFEAIDAGAEHTCALDANAGFVCWGSDQAGETRLRAPGAVADVDAGWYFDVALRSDGELDGWGLGAIGLTALPAGPFVSVEAGVGHGCALRVDGTPACFGWNHGGESVPPTGESFAALAVGGYHSCGLRSDGTAVCWGQDANGQAAVPAGATFTTLSAGMMHTCALRADGGVQCWGLNDSGQCDAPAGTFVAVSAGAGQSCALGVDQRVVCWGTSAQAPPDETFVAVSVGERACALRADGTVACWGPNPIDARVPAGSFEVIDSDYSQACGVRPGGEVECWGVRTRP